MSRQNNFFSCLYLQRDCHISCLKNPGLPSLSSKTFMGSYVISTSYLPCNFVYTCLITYFKSLIFITSSTQLTTIHVGGIQIGRKKKSIQVNVLPVLSGMPPKTNWWLEETDSCHSPAIVTWLKCPCNWLSHSFQQVSMPLLVPRAFTGCAGWLVKFAVLGLNPGPYVCSALYPQSNYRSS